MSMFENDFRDSRHHRKEEKNESLNGGGRQ